MKKILLSAIAVLALSSAVMAEDRPGNTQTGCGLGSQIIKDPDTAVLYSLQASTHGTGSQSIAITLGTMGCEKTKFVMNERAQEFVASNMTELAKEMAVGHGESIDTLAELLEISDKATFSASLQTNYNSIYTSKNVVMSDVLDNIATTSI